MNSNLVAKGTFTIPANSPANAALILDFDHLSNADAVEIKAMGFVEISNPNNKHYNFGFNVEQGNKTIDSVSKKFYEITGSANLSERFTAMEFFKPSNKKSQVVLTPTEASGAADIVVQVVLKYK